MRWTKLRLRWGSGAGAAGRGGAMCRPAAAAPTKQAASEGIIRVRSRTTINAFPDRSFGGYMFVCGACRAGMPGAQAGPPWPPFAAQNCAASVEPLRAVVEDCGRVNNSMEINEK